MTQFSTSDGTFRFDCLWADIAHAHICALTSEKEATSGVERLKTAPNGTTLFLEI